MPLLVDGQQEIAVLDAAAAAVARLVAHGALQAALVLVLQHRARRRPRGSHLMPASPASTLVPHHHTASRTCDHQTQKIGFFNRTYFLIILNF